jgi:hypothetical protein
MNKDGLKKFEVLVTQQTGETFLVWAHSKEEAEQIMDGDGPEDADWYVEPECVGELHILSQVESIEEVPEEDNGPFSEDGPEELEEEEEEEGEGRGA